MINKKDSPIHMQHPAIARIKAEYSSMNYQLSGDEIQTRATNILNLLKELAEDEKHYTRANYAMKVLFHTISKDVKSTVSSYNEMTKSNSAKKRRNEYLGRAYKTITQIHFDISSVLHAEES